MTKSRRGAANLHGFNVEREARYIALIEEGLKKAGRLRLEFKTLGKLAQYLSDLTGIHRTSLTYNVKYKVMLVEYLAMTRGHLDITPDSKASAATLRAKLIALRLESSNLQQRIRSLEASASSGPPLLVAQDGRSDSMGPDYLAFVDTAMTLTAVLERFEDTVSIDMNKKSIEDLAAPPSRRVIVGPERASPYIRWLRERQGLLAKVNDKG